jgi:hypothetical protein
VKKFLKRRGDEKVGYKNKQLMETIMFENSFKYHTKKERYPYLSMDINELYEIGYYSNHGRQFECLLVN